jgi:transcriptional regulator with XRE-family HTH domain
MYTTKYVGKNIKRARERQKMNQTQLADKTGLSCAAIYNYETGILKPTLNILVRLQAVLDVPLEYLLTK